jgi:phosphotransferase system  glucose/maltose/N-acetylglucosamine-specific IIC component
MLAKMSYHEAFKPVQRVRIVIIVAMIVILVVGILASLLLAKVGCSQPC